MKSRMTRRSLVAGSLVLSAALIAAGCGSGGSNGNSSSRVAAPTDQTRSQVRNLYDSTVRGMSQIGFPSGGMTFARNGFFSAGYGSESLSWGGGHSGGSVGGGIGSGTTGGMSSPPDDNGSGGGEGIRNVPMLGAFLNNIAANNPRSRAKKIRGITRQHPDGSGGGGSTEEYDPTISESNHGEEPYYDDPATWEYPTFYYDYYLGLWVQITDTASTSRYDLYEDEAKTKPAGHIEMTNPTNWDTYPQLYKSTYEFTAGYLAGSRGFSENVTNADYSGRSSYENVYSDGGKDKGGSSWSGRGDYSWTSRTETTDGTWSENAGSFRTDGSGGSRMSTSDGYKANYTFNTDGSGRGRVEGNDPGMPVTIAWDAYGNTTVRYADGTVERFPGWGNYYGGGGYGSVTGSGVGGGIGGGTGGEVRPMPDEEMPKEEPPSSPNR